MEGGWDARAGGCKIGIRIITGFNSLLIQRNYFIKNGQYTVVRDL